MTFKSHDSEDNRGVGYKPGPRDHLLASVGTLLVIFLAYGHRLLTGQSIFLDAIQEQYYLLGQYSFDAEIQRAFAAGLFPLWNPANALGTPLLGNMLSTVFFPLKLLIYFFPGLWMREAYIILRLFIAGYFTFIYARTRGLSAAACALAMAVFTLCGYFSMFVNENYLNADVLLPLMLLLIDRMVYRGRRVDIFLLSVLIFSVLNCGHPEAAFYALLFGAVYLIFIGTGRGAEFFFRQAARFSAALISGLIMSLPMLLPFLEYWARGYHFHIPGTGFFHYDPRQFSALLSPWFFHQAPPGAAFFRPAEIYWSAGEGVPDYAQSTVPWLIPWIGLLPAYLWLTALTRVRGLERHEIFFAAYSVFFLGVMFGLPPFNLIGYLPVFDFSGNFKHPLPAFSLAAALLAARGLDDLAGDKISRPRSLAALLFILLCITILWPLNEGADYFNHRTLAMTLIMTATALLLILGRSLSWNRSALLAAGLIGVFPGLLLDGQWPRGRDPGYLDRIEASEALARLRQEAEPFRTYISQDLFPPNLNLRLGLSDVRVMDGVNDRRFVEAINLINGHDRIAAGNYWYRETGYLQPRPDRLDHPLLGLFNVKYLLTSGPLPRNTFIDLVLKTAARISPGPNYIGRARLPFLKGRGPALFQHPPARLMAEISLPARSQGQWGLRFQPGIDPKAISEKDGVWFFMMSADASSGSALRYCRYLDPLRHSSDASCGITEVSLSDYQSEDADRKMKLTLITHPNADAESDWSGWSDLRLCRLPFSADLPGVELLSSGEVWLYQNGKARPRAFVVPHTQSVENLETADAGTGEGKMLEYGAQRIVIDGRAEMSAWLVLSDLYYPGWKALVRGKESRIYRGDYCLRAVRIPQGESRVEFIYRPWSFRIGLWSALCCLTGLVVICLRLSARPRKGV